MTCFVGFWFIMWSLVFGDVFPYDFWSVDLLIWFGEEWNTSITMYQRSSAGIPSIRKPASREITSASVELCETEVCFLYIQLFGTNVWLPKMHRIPRDVDSESSKSPAKSESWKNPNLHCCAVLSHNNIVSDHSCDACRKSNELSVCHRLWST